MKFEWKDSFRSGVSFIYIQCVSKNMHITKRLLIFIILFLFGRESFWYEKLIDFWSGEEIW